MIVPPVALSPVVSGRIAGKKLYIGLDTAEKEIWAEFRRDSAVNSKELLRRIADLKSTYEKNFENPWFFILLEGLPVDPLLLKDIRDFFKLDETWAITETRTREGIRNLELLIITLRHYLLPGIKERLRISPLRPEMMIKDRDQRAIRALVAYSIPLKIEILDAQLKSFKSFLDAHTQTGTSALSEKCTDVSA